MMDDRLINNDEDLDMIIDEAILIKAEFPEKNVHVIPGKITMEVYDTQKD